MQQRGSARRDASVSAVMLLRSWLDSSGLCRLHRCSWQSLRLGAREEKWLRPGEQLRWHPRMHLASWSRVDRRLWEIFTYIHAPRLGTKREGGVNTLSRCRPAVVPGYQRVRQLKCPLTYGKMESGAEASPQHLPRRKAVLHSLEDQKRVSY